MRPFLAFLIVLVVCLASLGAQARKTFDIYSIDVEGGGATLFVSPSGQSLLIDSGYQSNGRDAERIMAAAKDAGLTQIDHLITSHYHGDHMGGLAELVARFPVKHLIDHGENSTPQSSGTGFIQGYMDLAAKLPRTSVKAGRQGSDGRVGLVNRLFRREAAVEAAARCRQAEPGVRELPEAGRNELRRLPRGWKRRVVR